MMPESYTKEKWETGLGYQLLVLLANTIAKLMSIVSVPLIPGTTYVAMLAFLHLNHPKMYWAGGNLAGHGT